MAGALSAGGNEPVIIITGASQGIGAATASIAAECGARVVLAARNEAMLVARAEQIRNAGGEALPVRADVSSPEDCRRIVERALDAFGRIDALINNAATIEPIAFVAEARPEEWAHHVGVNLLGPVLMSQLAIPHLRQSGGRLLNVTSVAAEIVITGFSAYSTSKAALNRFTAVLAAEEPGITVVGFIPGDVDTGMQAAIRAKGKGKGPDELYNLMVAWYEQGILLRPETPARAAVSIALSAPREWSGEVLRWDDERVRALADHGDARSADKAD